MYKVYDIKVGPDKDGEVHPLDLTRTYRVATTSFYTYESGDGCTAFSDKVEIMYNIYVILYHVYL